MTSPLHRFIYQWRYSALLSVVLLAVLLITFHWLSGSFSTNIVPSYFSSVREFQGMVALVIIVPVYIVGAFFYSQRRSVELAKAIDDITPLNLKASIENISPSMLLMFGTLGLLYALIFNVPGNGLNVLVATATERAVIFGQILIWTLVGALLYLRIHAARQFSQAGTRIDVDIFEPSKLRPFAQPGLADVLIVTAGMVLSSVQALDFTFRPDNYSKALVILAPALVFLAIYPMWGLHLKMRRIRQAQLDELNGLINGASKSLATDAVNYLETLLQRRERVISATTWPVDIAFLQRLVFYIIIPPLAWTGAAFVEYLINDIMSSG